TWLKTHNYRVTPAMEPIIMAYVKEGMFFVAMRLSQDATVGDIKPIVLTYAGIHPMIPIRLTAVAAEDDMPILTWIFGDTQYVPKNYAQAIPDFRTFRAPPEVANVAGDPRGVGIYYAAYLYSGELKRLQDLYHGQAFVTEFAGSTKTLHPSLYTDGR